MDCIKEVNEVKKTSSTLKNDVLLRITNLKPEIMGGIWRESKANVMTKFEKMKEDFSEIRERR